MDSIHTATNLPWKALYAYSGGSKHLMSGNTDVLYPIPPPKMLSLNSKCYGDLAPQKEASQIKENSFLKYPHKLLDQRAWH